MTVSSQCPFRAWYELHGVTTELTTQRKEDEKGSVVVGRGELRSGEVRPWKRWRKKGQCALTETQSVQPRGGGGRGEHGRAVMKM